MKVNPFQKSHLFVAVVFIGVLLLSLTASPSALLNKQKQLTGEELVKQRRDSVSTDGLKIKNAAKGLTVINTEIMDRDIKVTLRNNYHKTITAFRVSVGESIMGTELFASDNESNFLLPGSEIVEIYSYQPEIEKSGLNVLAVIFEDRTTDGDLQNVEEMQEQRLGRKMLRRNAVRLLEKALKLKPAELSTAIVNLESELLPVSENELKELPPNVESGLRAERSIFIRKLQAFQRGQVENIRNATYLEGGNSYVKVRNELNTLVEKYKQSISKL
jgi:hypothetical protein